MEIKCPHCGTLYEIDDSEFGKLVRCEICRRGFIVGTTKPSKKEEATVDEILGIPQGAELKLEEQKKSEQQRREEQERLHRERYEQEEQMYKQRAAKQSLSSGGLLRGRATRSEYWDFVAPFLFGLSIFMIPRVICIVKSAIHNEDPGLEPLQIILFVDVVALVYNLLTFPVTVRRLHDRNMSGWFLLAFFVGSLIPVAGWFVGLAQFIIIGCLDGTVGPNEFGPDPKGRKPMQPQFVVPPSSVAGHESPEDRLLKLQKLKEAGIVSEEEYEEKRRKLLAEI